MIDPLTTFIVSTAASCVVKSILNHRENKHKAEMQAAIEAYQREALGRGHKAALSRLDKLRDIKLQILRDEWDNVRLSRQNNHNTLINSIAKLSDLDNWPLSVPPIVINNLPLKYGLNGSDDLFVEPLHVIITPTINKSFNTLLFCNLENELSNYFHLNHSANSNHPIIYYKGCWDKTRLNFNPLIDNLNTKLNTVPVVIITPQISRGKFKLSITCWNIHGWNDSIGQKSNFIVDLAIDESVSDVLNKHFLQSKSFDILIQSMGMIVSMLSDKYMWSTYKIPPQLLKMLSGAWNQCNTPQNIISIYRSYLSFLRDSINNNTISPVLDMEHVVNYLECTDAVCRKKDGLSIVIEYCPKNRDCIQYPKTLADILFFGEEYMRPLVKYCSDFYWLYQYPIDELIVFQKTWVGCSLTDRINNYVEINVDDFKKNHCENYSDIISCIRGRFEYLLKSDYKTAICAIKDKEGVWNELYHPLYGMLSEKFQTSFNRCIPSICQQVKIAIISDKLKNLSTNYQIEFNLFSQLYTFLPGNLIFEASNDALYYLEEKIRNYKYPTSNFYESEKSYFRAYNLINDIVETHINVPFIGKDQLIVKYSIEQSNYFFSKYMSYVWESVVAVANAYVERCFGIPYVPPTYHDYDNDFYHEDYSNELPGSERVG